ncbi:hypothetical protein [Flavobacterium album]|nr:hypothetical protein [Flavobacterium album]
MMNSKFFKVNSEGKLTISIEEILKNSDIESTGEVETALLIINNYWENKTMDGTIAGIVLNNNLIHEVPANANPYNNTIDLQPLLSQHSNILTINFYTIDVGPWKNTGTTTLIINGHNVETLIYTSGGDNERMHQITRVINN